MKTFMAASLPLLFTATTACTDSEPEDIDPVVGTYELVIDGDPDEDAPDPATAELPLEWSFTVLDVGGEYQIEHGSVIAVSAEPTDDGVRVTFDDVVFVDAASPSNCIDGELSMSLSLLVDGESVGGGGTAAFGCYIGDQGLGSDYQLTITGSREAINDPGDCFAVVGGSKGC